MADSFVREPECSLLFSLLLNGRDFYPTGVFSNAQNLMGNSKMLKEKAGIPLPPRARTELKHPPWVKRHRFPKGARAIMIL